ncbi:hypothetical protein BCR39DRAFT_515816 [Naematelia encephala]|uniref:Uncharacterized protein n=1 Tax=Naematelia encephala TaxID=71784 RepID=A0A1Y2BJM3_9TREE|nr:hypothetical protein BCR39DRAFT_515816 [Naematelia encephala]
MSEPQFSMEVVALRRVLPSCKRVIAYTAGHTKRTAITLVRNMPRVQRLSIVPDRYTTFQMMGNFYDWESTNLKATRESEIDIHRRLNVDLAPWGGELHADVAQVYDLLLSMATPSSSNTRVSETLYCPSRLASRLTSGHGASRQPPFGFKFTPASVPSTDSATHIDAPEIITTEATTNDDKVGRIVTLVFGDLQTSEWDERQYDRLSIVKKTRADDGKDWEALRTTFASLWDQNSWYSMEEIASRVMSDPRFA